MDDPTFENDRKRELIRVSPGGVETRIKPYEACGCCGAHCRYNKVDMCAGEVNYLSDIREHLCEKHGSDNSWYKSVPSERELVGPAIGL